MPTEEEIIKEMLKFDPGRQAAPEEIDPAIIQEVLKFDPGRVGGTYQRKESPVPGGTAPISTVTGKEETGPYVPGKEGSAGIGTLIKAGFIDDPQKQIQIYADARGIPASRYRVFNGEIIFRDKDGNWQRETGELPLSMLKRGVAQTVTNPAVIGGTVGALVGGPKGAMAGAAGGELAREAIGAGLAADYQDPVSNVAKVYGEGLLAFGGEAIGSLIKGAIMGHRLAATGLKKGAGALRVVDFTPQDHLKAQMMKDLAQQHGIDLPLHQAYNKESLNNFWMYLRKHPVTADKIKEIEDQLSQQGDDAIQSFVREVRGAPAESPVEIGDQAKGAATKAIADAESQRAEAVYPIYVEAFKAADEAGGVDISPVIKNLDSIIETYPNGPTQKILRSVRQKLGTEEDVKLTRSRMTKRDVVTKETKPLSFRNYVREMGGIAIDDPNYTGEIRDIFKGARWGPGVVTSRHKGGIEMDELLSRIKEGGQWKGMIETEDDSLNALAQNPTNAGVGFKGATEDQFSEAARQYAEQAGKVRERSDWKPTINRIPKVMFTPEKNLRKIQKALFEINDIIEGTAHEAATISPSSKNVLTRDLMSIKTQLLERIGKVSPDFLEANARFAELSEPIDALKRSVVGELSRLSKDKTTAEATAKLFDATSIKDPELLWRARASIEPQDPGLWRKMIGSYISDVYERLIISEGEPISAFGKFERKLFGSPRQREIMEAAMGPELFDQFSGLMSVLKRSTVGTRGQSMTAQFLAMEKELSPIKGTAPYRWASQTKAELVNSLMGRWNDMVVAGRQTELLDAMLSEDAVAKLSNLRKLSPGSRKLIDGLSAYTALISTKIGIEETGNQLPPGQPPGRSQLRPGPSQERR
jgi:hypothetical protein